MERNNSFLSFACVDAICEERAQPLIDQRWRGRSFGMSMERCAEQDSLTVSLRFTASECDLVGMGLQRIPLTSPSSPPREKDEDRPSDSTSVVHRVVKMRIGSISSR